MHHTPAAALKAGFAAIEQYGSEAATTRGPWTDLYGSGRGDLRGDHRQRARRRPPTGSPTTGCARSRSSPPASTATRFLAAIDAAMAVQPKQRPRRSPRIPRPDGRHRGARSGLARAAARPDAGAVQRRASPARARSPCRTGRCSPAPNRQRRPPPPARRDTPSTEPAPAPQQRRQRPPTASNRRDAVMDEGRRARASCRASARSTASSPARFALIGIAALVDPVRHARQAGCRLRSQRRQRPSAPRRPRLRRRRRPRPRPRRPIDTTPTPPPAPAAQPTATPAPAPATPTLARATPAPLPAPAPLPTTASRTAPGATATVAPPAAPAPARPCPPCRWRRPHRSSPRGGEPPGALHRDPAEGFAREDHAPPRPTSSSRNADEPRWLRPRASVAARVTAQRSLVGLALRCSRRAPRPSR